MKISECGELECKCGSDAFRITNINLAMPSDRYTGKCTTVKLKKHESISISGLPKHLHIKIEYTCLLCDNTFVSEHIKRSQQSDISYRVDTPQWLFEQLDFNSLK